MISITYWKVPRSKVPRSKDMILNEMFVALLFNNERVSKFGVQGALESEYYVCE